MINLTQHKSTPDQGCSEIVNVKRLRSLLTFKKLPGQLEITARAEHIARMAVDSGHDSALIGGAPFLMPVLALALKEKGIVPFYAFSERVSTEKDGIKTSVFNHVGFIKA